MIGSLLSMVGSAFAGGATGLLGNLFTGWMKIKQKKQDNEHELALRAADREEMRLEADLHLKQTRVEVEGRIAVATTEAEAAKDIAASELREASYDHDKASYSAGIIAKLRLTGFWGGIAGFLLLMVDVLRGLIRPLGTVAAFVIMVDIAYTLNSMEQMDPTSDQAWTLFVTVVDTIIYLSVTSYTWWFGDRRQSKK